MKLKYRGKSIWLVITRGDMTQVPWMKVEVQADWKNKRDFWTPAQTPVWADSKQGLRDILPLDLATHFIPFFQYAMHLPWSLWQNVFVFVYSRIMLSTPAGKLWFFTWNPNWFPRYILLPLQDTEPLIVSFSSHFLTSSDSSFS